MRLPRLAIEQEGNVIAVAVTPDGRTIFAGSDPTRDAMRTLGNKPADVFVYRAADGKLVRRLHGFYWRANAVTSSPDSRVVLASGYTHPSDSGPSEFQEAEVIAWDWGSGRELWTTRGDLPLSYSQAGRLISIGDGIHEEASGKTVVRIPRSVSSDSQSAFSPDGKLFGLIGAPTLDKNGFMDSETGGKLYYSTTRLSLWRTGTGEESRDFPFTRVRAFDFSRDGRWLALLSDRDSMTGGTDGSVLRRVDLATGAVAWVRDRKLGAPDHDPDAVFNSLVISPNGKYLIAQSGSGQLVVLDAGTGRELFRPFAHQRSGEPQWALPGASPSPPMAARLSVAVGRRCWSGTRPHSGDCVVKVRGC